ncbi:MAG: alcohol dehydrogenase catalytic domain-containing protein, partial [Chitinophagaceae bacterium]
MKVIQCIEPGSLILGEANHPICISGNAIIKIKRIGICGTDLHAFEGVQPYFSYPRILGHELAGEIVEIDNQETFQVGDIVTIIPYFHCGTCIACRNGKPNCCLNLRVCGVHQDGGMTEYLSVPIYTLVKGYDMDPDVLALIEPFAIGAHGVRRSGLKKNDSTLIIGAGPIGLATAAMALAKGAKVMIMDINANRLQVAESKLGISNIILATGAQMEEKIKEYSGGDMPVVVFDCTGNLGAINQGFQFMAHGGTYV